MDTTPMPFTSRLFFILLCLLAAVPAWAQRSVSQAQKLEWPRTFTGQPDFAFTRDEALLEARTRATRDNESIPSLPLLDDLLIDETKFDPLGLTTGLAAAAVDVSDTESVSGTDSIHIPTLMDKLMANVVGLPNLGASTTLDLTEFKATLDKTIQNTVRQWQPRTGSYTFGALAKNLILQAVVTSPQHYAIINNQRYAIGDSFQMRVPIDVPDMEILSALQNQMPNAETFPPAIQQQYQDAYEAAIAVFAQSRQSNRRLGQQVVSIPVTIKDIQPRKVLIDINGEAHELTIKYAY